MKIIKEEKQSSHEEIFNRILTDHKFRQQVVRESFEFFFPIYLSQYMIYESAPFHKELFKILENEKNKLAVIVAFRGSAKSTIITTAYVLWSILGIQQHKFIVICGQTEQKARAYLANIKNQLLENSLLRKDLGPFEEEKNSLGNATALIIKRLNVKIMICSVEQSIRGIRHNEHRPDLIILDDIEDISSVKTRENRNKTFDWLTGEIIPAGNRRTRIIAVGNLLHEDSTLKRLQKKIDKGEMSRLNGIYREYPIIDNQGNALWPGKYPTGESIEEEHEKTMDEIAWQREYMLKIIASDEQVVNPKWINFYDKMPADKFRGIYIGIDLAISEKESADCTAIVVGYVYGMGKKMRVYIQPNPINKRITFPEQLEIIKEMIKFEKIKHHNVKVFIEDVGYQKAIIQALDSDKYNVESFTTNGTDKTTRLRLTTPFLKDGYILFPEEGCEELIDQLTGFGKENHDDLADAFAILTLKIFENNPITETGILLG
jgi:predicted phage terminase large subunit-like protein